MKGLPRSLRRGRAAEKPIIKQRIKLTNFPITIADPGGAVAFAGAQIADLPEGNVLFLGAVSNLTFVRSDTDISATFTPTFALGTTVTADATLNSTDANLIPSTAGAAASAGTSGPNRGASTGTESGAVLNNTDGSLEVNLNVTIPDADIAAASGVLVTGDVELSYVMLLDD